MRGDWPANGLQASHQLRFAEAGARTLAARPTASSTPSRSWHTRKPGRGRRAHAEQIRTGTSGQGAQGNDGSRAPDLPPGRSAMGRQSGPHTQGAKRWKCRSCPRRSPSARSPPRSSWRRRWGSRSHDMRRSFGSRYAAVVPAPVLQRLMRHSDIKTTLTYYADVDGVLDEAILKA